MKIRLRDLEDAFMFADAGAELNAGAYLDRETGEVRYSDRDMDDADGEAEELASSDRYLRVPNKHDLDLGTPLVFDFAERHLPDDYDRVQDMFRGRGAYRRYKDFLEDKDMLDTWYDFEHAKTLEALREWAEGEGVEVDES